MAEIENLRSRAVRNKSVQIRVGCIRSVSDDGSMALGKPGPVRGISCALGSLVLPVQFVSQTSLRLCAPQLPAKARPCVQCRFWGAIDTWVTAQVNNLVSGGHLAPGWAQPSRFPIILDQVSMLRCTFLVSERLSRRAEAGCGEEVGAAGRTQLQHMRV